MKHNTLKRVLAGSLALLTVASPMTANVGGILQEFAIVASASQGDPVIISWGYHLYDYLDEVRVGEDVIDFSKLTTPTSEFKFMTGQGKEATIISKVPLADFGYRDVTDDSKEYGFKGIQPGEYTVEKSDDNKWTYNLVLKTATGNLDTLSLSGAVANATFKFDANGVAGYDDKTRLSDFGATITYVGATEEKTESLTGSNVSGDSFGYEDPGDFSLTQNTKATITAEKSFMVKVLDSADVQQYQTVPAKYNAKTKTYSATVTVPVTLGTVDMTVAALDGTQLVYTADKNYLTVNGEGVEEDQVAASITASAYREEVRDENEKLIDEEFKADDFAYNGKTKYGQKETDGVIVKINSDSKLTTSRDNNDGSTPLVKLSIFKDDSIWAGVENLYFKKDDLGKWTLVDINGNPATYVDTDHVYSKYSLNDEGELTGETKLTEEELVSLFNDGTVENPFLFTESGKYVVKATFYTKKYDDQSSTLGSEEQKLEYWFNIEPLKATAQDLTFQLFHDPDFENPVTGLTPRPVVFNEDGSVVIPVPEKYQDDVYYVKIAPNQSSKTNPEFAKFTAVLNGNAIPTSLADGKGKYYVDGSLTVSKLDETVKVKFENYDQNWGATTDSKNVIIPDITELTYKLSTSDQIPEINLVDDPEDVVYYYEGSSYTKAYGGILRVAKSDTEAEKFEQIFWSNYKGNAVVENNMDKVQFAYMPGMGKSWEDDYLSLTTNGIPTTVNQDGYTLFVMYDGEPIWSGDLMVVSTKAILRMKDSALNQTYGDRLDTENYELVDENGNVLSDLSLDGLVIKSIHYAADKDAGLKSGRKNGVTPYYNPDGTYATTIEVTDDNCPGVTELSYNGYYNYMIGQIYDYTNATLNAGTYVVDYDVYYDYNSDFIVKTPEQILNVAKRQITDDMFFIEDQAYDGKDKDRNAIKFRWAAKDEDGKILNELKQDECDDPGVGEPVHKHYDDDGNPYYTIERDYIRVTVTDGQEHAKDVDRYELALRANELKEYNQYDETCFTGNFTGTAAVDWCITAREKSGYTANDPHQDINPGFKWNTENTSVYDNGRIHVDFSIADENNMKLPKGVTLVDYGVVGCKSDQLAAPTRKTEDGREKKLTIAQYEDQKKGDASINKALFGEELMDEVMGALKYRNLKARGENSFGNGFFEGHVSAKNREQKIYGANISVQDAQTGEWVLPYALYSDGTVVYGDAPIYLDLTMEATRVLQLKLNPEYFLDKDKGQAYAGYKEDTADYKAYAYYKAIDTAKVKAQVQDFGVVVAKEGQFDRSGMSFDGKTTVEDGLKLSKKDKFNLKIGHNDKNGEILKQEEYGANISVVNYESGVWLNAYLDLGNGLVVYTPCEYYEPVSDYYSGAGTGDVDNDSVAVFQHGALTREDDENLYHLDLEDLNETAYNAADQDDTNHNRRVTDKNKEDNVGNGKIAKPGKVRTTFVNNQYTFQFDNTVLGSNPNNYTFVENGVVLCNDDSLVERATFYAHGDDGEAKDVTVYRLRKDAANKLVLGNGYIEGKHNKDQNKAVYTGRIENKNNKVQVVRAWQKFRTNEGKEVIVYGDITMNYMGMNLDINEDGIATIQNGRVERIPVEDASQAELDFLYDFLRRGYPSNWMFWGA